MVEETVSETPRTEIDEFILSLPLDWDHFPADAQEGWDMICRAKVRYIALEQENADLRKQLAEAERRGMLRAAEICRRDGKMGRALWPYGATADEMGEYFATAIEATAAKVGK